MNTPKLISLSILSGILLAFSWFPYGFTPLVFIAFVPLFIVEREISFSKHKSSVLLLLLSAFTTFFLWNIIVTWWIKNASFGGAAMAIVTNAILMSTVFVISHNVKKRIGQRWMPIIFISFWVSFEYFHFNWDATYPWLTLGNVFADKLSWIQWYEYTGVFGGSVWVLIVNFLIYSFLSGVNEAKALKMLSLLGTVLLPLIASYLIERNVVVDSDEKVNIVLLQPNVDPYSNTRYQVSARNQISEMLEQAKSKIDSTTDYLILPETALANTIWEKKLNYNGAVVKLNDYLKSHPKLNVLLGASTAKMYEDGEKLSPTVRKFTDVDLYYDYYNTALQFSANKQPQIYHKSKLVPGVERMPFPQIFKYVEAFAIDLGGATGSLGTQEERSVFISDDTLSKVAPVICYESIYGEFVGGFVNNGAGFIAIITNDAWWGDTPGYKQHLKYGALRAIETRRWIARSANTGVSCFINPKGELIKPTKYGEPDVVAHTISRHTIKTFYTTYGDYIGRYAKYITLVLLVYSWLIQLKLFKNSTFVNT